MGKTVSVRHVGHFSAAHSLKLPYPSPCGKLHGHNWIIETFIELSGKGRLLSEDGMVLDFSVIEEIVSGFDHRCLNDCIDQPTAENVAGVIACSVLPLLPKHATRTVKVTVSESEGHEASIALHRLPGERL